MRIERLLKPFLVFILLILLGISSCDVQYKPCEYEFTDENLQVYNDAIIQINEKYRYNVYLKENFDLWYFDSLRLAGELNYATYQKEIIKAQNRLYGDTAHFCYLILDTVFEHTFSNFKQYYPIDSFQEFGNITEIDDSLCSTQHRYKASDFKFCTFAIKSPQEVKSINDGCFLAYMGFSKICFNRDKTLAVFYYDEINQGYGRGELLYMEKKGKHWYLKKKDIQWIT